jgi:hypothetical protein
LFGSVGNFREVSFNLVLFYAAIGSGLLDLLIWRFATSFFGMFEATNLERPA